MRQKGDRRAIGAEQIDHREMIDEIIGGITGRDLLGINAIGLARRIDGGRRSRHPDQPRMKGRDERLDRRHIIAFRIDGDEHRRHPRAARGAGLFIIVKAARNIADIGGADIGAEGIAEIHQPILPGEILVGDGFAILIDQRKTAAERGAGEIARRRRRKAQPAKAERQQHGDAKDDPEAAAAHCSLFIGRCRGYAKSCPGNRVEQGSCR